MESIAKIAESTKPVRNPRPKNCCQQTPEEQLGDREKDASIKDEEHVVKRWDLDEVVGKKNEAASNQTIAPLGMEFVLKPFSSALHVISTLGSLS